jgi:hypothetical protein
MNRLNPAQRALAHRCLAIELAGQADVPTAAGRIYEKILRQLSPLIGILGVRALFARSVQLTKVAHPGLAEYDALALALAEPPFQISPADPLRDCLQAQPPQEIEPLVIDLFGTFFALLTALIGEHLTNQLIEGAWPASSAPGPVERKT